MEAAAVGVRVTGRARIAAGHAEPAQVVHAGRMTEQAVRQSGRARSSRVEVRSMNQPKLGWDLTQALRMLHEGYGVEHVSRRSGYAVPFLKAQLRLVERGRKPAR